MDLLRLWNGVQPRSDIRDGLPYLIELASCLPVIVELGCAYGHGSTRAFTLGLERNPSPDKLHVSVDIRRQLYSSMTPEAGWWRMVVGNTIDPRTVGAVRGHLDGRQISLLFIDTDHSPQHVLRELRLWLPLCDDQSFCVLHDTSLTGPFKPYAQAIRDYARDHGLVYRDILADGFGLGQLTRH